MVVQERRVHLERAVGILDHILAPKDQVPHLVDRHALGSPAWTGTVYCLNMFPPLPWAGQVAAAPTIFVVFECN